MLEKLSYNQRCFMLIIGLCLFFVAGYKFSFSDTFELMDQIETNQEKLDWLIEKEKQLPALKAKMAEFDKAYQKGDSASVRDNLTAFISEYADSNEGCMVTEIPQNILFLGKNMKVQTNSFTIKGNFNQLVTILNLLEKKFKYTARVMSARFFVLTDNQLKRKNLYLTIITQTFGKGKHESN